MRKPEPTPALDIACCTETGPTRERNEDACALPPTWAEPTALGTLLVVADGVGGVSGGAEASHDAVGYLQAIYYAPSGPEAPADRLNQAVRAVNTLNRLSAEKEREGLTTLVAAVIRGAELWVANVGDSRAYLFQNESQPRKQLTKDHTGSQSHAITHAIGLEDECQVDLYRYEWHPGDALVLCSDGLAALSAQEMAEITFSLPAEGAAGALVQRAHLLDGSDNATAVVARWGGPPDSQRRAAPTRTAGPQKRDTIPVRSDPDPPRDRLGRGLLLGLLLGWLTAALLLYAAIAGGTLPGF